MKIPNRYVGPTALRKNFRGVRQVAWSNAASGVPGFAATGPNPGDLCIRTSPASPNGAIGIREDAPTGVGYYAIMDHAYTIDDQSLSITLADQGGPLSNPLATCIYTHSDAAHTNGAYCRVFNGSIEVGSYTRSGATYVYTPFPSGTVETSITSGSSVTFLNQQNSWSVRVADDEVLSVNSGSIVFDSVHRTGVVSMDRRVVPVIGIVDSFRIASVTLSDYVTPAYVGSGAKISKTNTTAHTASSSVPKVISLNYFDTIEAASLDVGVDLTNAIFTVSFPGWYKVVIKYKCNVTTGVATARFHVCLFKNGVVYEYGSGHSAGYDGTNPLWAPGFQSVHTVYLEAGDNVQAAYQTSLNSVNFLVGEATGLENYFSIALLTKDLN